MPTPLPHALCLHLRSKKLYMVDEEHEVCVEDMQSAGYVNYWCLHTQTDTAEDGGWVTYEHCAPGRPCFEPMARSTGAAGVACEADTQEWPDPYAVSLPEPEPDEEPADRPTFVELLRKRTAVPRA